MPLTRRSLCQIIGGGVARNLLGATPDVCPVNVAGAVRYPPPAPSSTAVRLPLSQFVTTSDWSDFVHANAAFQSGQCVRMAHWHRGCCAADDPAVNVHSGAQFFLWHRLVVHLYETFLQSQGLKSPIPYWDWEQYPEIPSQYNQNQSLWPLDFNGVPQTRDSGIIDRACLDTTGILTPTDFGKFSAVALNGPHAYIHDMTSLQMRSPETSALDPLFYAHHATMDRLFYRWKLMNPAYKVPPPGFAQKRIDFDDFEGQHRYITWADLWDETGFGYKYDVPDSAPAYSSQPLTKSGSSWQVPEGNQAAGSFLRFENIDLSKFSGHHMFGRHEFRRFQLSVIRQGVKKPFDCLAVFGMPMKGSMAVDWVSPIPANWTGGAVEFQIAPLDEKGHPASSAKPLNVSGLQLVTNQ